MTIKNKDGSVYKLNGPNPVMKKQEVWDEKEGFKLHNCSWGKEVVTDDLPKVEPMETDFTIRESPSEPKKEMEIKVVDRQKEEEVPEIRVVERQQPTEPKMRVKQLHDKIIFHCMQAINVRVQDDFYGETRPKIGYDKTFSFEAVIASENDINMVFWTNIQIATQSIVYPQNGEKRWWEVVEVQERGGGYLHITIPTTVNPSFEK